MTSSPRARLALLVAVLSVALVTGVTAGATTPRRALHTIQMKGFKYRPDSLRIGGGDTVLFVNADDEPHSISIDTIEFDSGDIAPGSKFRWVFRQKGRFRYHCEVHPKMKGLLIVR